MASVDWAASPSRVGTNSGVIVVSRIERRVAPTSSLNWPEAMTHRMRCWMSVLGTPVLTP